MRRCNVVLTGVPRSGTTLICYLLNKLPDTVALHEPLEMGKYAPYGRSAVSAEIDRFFEQSRLSLIEHGTAISQHAGGKVPDNPVKDQCPRWLYLLPGPFRNLLTSKRIPGLWLRRTQVSRGSITIDKPLSKDFTLCIKHPSAFTAILDDLYDRYPCYALVRNPLSVLASWNTVSLPVRQGHVPQAEGLDADLAHRLAQTPDQLERQLIVLSWFFQRYHVILPDENVLRYEDIIASRGKALSAITDKASELDEPLGSKNANELYNRPLMRALGERLLKTDGAFWEFYTRTSVMQLLDELDSPNQAGR